MEMKYPILGQVQDVEGTIWDVRDIRTTKHGFDLLFGSPASMPIHRWGLPRLIATKPLYDFWDANRTRRNGAIYDLPAGRSTIKRIRHRLGFNSLKDLSKFWRARITDLQELSAREFAAKHGVKLGVVFETRFKVLGRQARDLDWWHDPAALRVLRSNITLREIGEKLDISTSHAKRLRDRARQQQQTALVGVEPGFLQQLAKL